MTLRHLKIFETVYRNMNITKASTELYMTQPAITRAIQELENHYGTKLFERLNRGLQPTQAGTTLYYKAIHLLEEAEQLELSFIDFEATGRLRIGFTISLGNSLLPELLPSFRAQYPKLEINAYIENAHKLEEKLMANEIDICFIEGHLSNPNLTMKAFSHDRLILVASPESPLAQKEKVHLADLTDVPLCTREKGSISRFYTEDAFYSRNLVPSIILESESTQAIVKAVMANIGIALLPESLIQRELEKGDIVKIDMANGDISRTNYIVWHKDKYVSKAMQSLIQLACEFQKTKR